MGEVCTAGLSHIIPTVRTNRGDQPTWMSCRDVAGALQIPDKHITRGWALLEQTHQSAGAPAGLDLRSVSRNRFRQCCSR